MRAVLLIVVLVGVWLMNSRRVAAAVPAGNDIPGLIDRINAEDHGGWFDPFDVLAVIEIESAFDPGAYRAEPSLGDASRGLMQILLSTARDRGYGGPADGLFDPEVNLRVGMAHLRWGYEYLEARMGERPALDQWIGAYNAGVGAVLRGFLPLTYVRRWKAARRRYGDG